MTLLLEEGASTDSTTTIIEKTPTMLPIAGTSISLSNSYSL